MRQEDVIREANQLIRQHFRVTVRQIYYQIYPKFHQDYKNARSFYTSFDKMLVKARENGEVSVSRVIDTARDTMGGDHGYTNPNDYLKGRIDDLLKMPNRYSRKRWENQEVTPIVWVEKDALSRIIHSVSRRYKVMTCPSRGYSSMHYLYNIAKDREDIKILHFADHDPSGLDMTRDVRKRISELAGSNIQVERIALTHEQVKEYDLVPNPTKSADTRRKAYVDRFGDRCWELDALPPDKLKDLVEDSIENEIDQDDWDENIEQQKKEKKKLEKVVEKIKVDLKDLTLD